MQGSYENLTHNDHWTRWLLPQPRSVQTDSGSTIQWPKNPTAKLHGVNAPCAVVRTALDALGIQHTDDSESCTVQIVIKSESATLTPPIQQQHYQLIIDATHKPGVSIHAATPIAARYALMTLAQIIRISHGRLPPVRIDDAPSIALRGLMLDISRDRVPTMDFAKQLITTLAALKINHLQFYMEHTFAYAGHESIWQNASPLTPAQIESLDTFAQSHGIELIPNQNCFGHLTRFLTHPDYKHLAETHGSWVFDNGQVRVPRTGPFSLCPTDPASIDFITSLLAQLIPCFKSPRIHLGCDETFDIGTGRSKKQVNKHGRTKVSLDFVKQIIGSATRIRTDAQPMIWADLLLTEDRKAAQSFDRDVAALVWGYEHDTPFESQVQRLLEDSDAQREIWVCPGTSAWRSITGRTSTRNANIAAAARTAVEHNLTGILMTEWGDHGHRQHWPIALHAIAHAAAVAWNESTASAIDNRAIGMHAFDDATGTLGEYIAHLGNLDQSLRQQHNLFNASAIYTDMHEPLTTQSHVGTLRDWQTLRDQYKVLEEQFTTRMVVRASRPYKSAVLVARASRPCESADPDTHTPRQRTTNQSQPDTNLITQELTHTLTVARFAIDRAIHRRDPQPNSKSKLIEAITSIIADHRALWLHRSRPGGLDDSARYYESIRDELIHHP